VIQSIRLIELSVELLSLVDKRLLPGVENDVVPDAHFEGVDTVLYVQPRVPVVTPRYECCVLRKQW